jgi:ATP-dependent protease ClpP protease subunit
MEIVLKGTVNAEMEEELIDIFEDNLIEFPSLKTIKIKVSSDGGYVDVGFRIHNYLRGLQEQNGLQIITHNIDTVESTAVNIFCGGNQRVVSPYSTFMVHGYYRQLNGNFTSEAIQNSLEEFRLDLEAAYQLFSNCTNLPVQQVAGLFKEQTYFDAKEALELGLAHSIMPATFDRDADIRCVIDVPTSSEEEETE